MGFPFWSTLRVPGGQLSLHTDTGTWYIHRNQITHILVFYAGDKRIGLHIFKIVFIYFLPVTITLVHRWRYLCHSAYCLPHRCIYKYIKHEYASLQSDKLCHGSHKHARQNSPSLQRYLLHRQLSCHIIAYGLSVSSLLAFSQLTSGLVTQLAHI